MLLCIEMAIFAVMHLFAFPWREYDLSNMKYGDPVTAPGSGYSGAKPEYKGGKFGLKAWLDAFNLWDIIKASARGFRWLFVGRKHRHHDISYQSTEAGGPGLPGSVLNGPQTSIPGPNVTSDTIPSATELQGRQRSDTVEQNFDDRVGLLSHAQESAISPLPSPGYDSEVDIGGGSGIGGRVPPSAAFPEAAPYGGRYAAPLGTTEPTNPGIEPWDMDMDTGYHAAPSALSSQQQQHLPHGQGQSQGQGPEWDHWAGARRG